MENIRVFESNKEYIADKYSKNWLRSGLDSAVGIKPQKGIEYKDSIESMRDYLESNVDEPTGIEYIYDHNRGFTSINLLADNEEGESSTFRNFKDKHDVGTTLAEDPLQNLSEDTYVAGARIEFGNDYWHMFYNEDEDTTRNEDELRRILEEIAVNGKEDVSTSIQITKHPVPDSKWNKRYTVKQVLLKPLLVFPSLVYMFIMALFLFPLYALYSQVKYNRIKLPTSLDKFDGYGSYIYQTLSQMAGYTQKDFIKSYEFEEGQVKKDLKGVNVANILNSIDRIILNRSNKDNFRQSGITDETLVDAYSKVKNKASEKSEKQGFVTNIRVVMIGNDPDKVEKKMKRLKKLYESTYNTRDSNPRVQQKIVFKPITNGYKLSELITEMATRQTEVDSYGRIRSRYSWRSWHVTRTKPMIMVPSELVKLAHIPSDIVDDKSIQRSEDSSDTNVHERYT